MKNVVCEGETSFSFSPASSGQWKYKYIIALNLGLFRTDTGLLINEMFFVHSRGTVCSCFYLLLALVLNTTGELTVNKDVWHCYFFTCLKWLGRRISRDFRFAFDKCPADACPESMWDKYWLDCFLHVWIVNIPDILCGEQQEDGVLCLSRSFI